MPSSFAYLLEAPHHVLCGVGLDTGGGGGRGIVKNTRVTDDVITRDKNEYSSHALAGVKDGKTGMSGS